MSEEKFFDVIITLTDFVLDPSYVKNTADIIKKENINVVMNPRYKEFMNFWVYIEEYKHKLISKLTLYSYHIEVNYYYEKMLETINCEEISNINAILLKKMIYSIIGNGYNEYYSMFDNPEICINNIVNSKYNDFSFYSIFNTQ